MKKSLVLVAGSLLLAGAMAPLPAEAGVRLTVSTWGVPYFETYSPPYAPHWRRRVPPPDLYGSSYYDDYGDQGFDESYYDPYYLPPSAPPQRLYARKHTYVAVPKAKKSAVARNTAVKSATKVATASLTNKSESGKSTSLSCDKATSIVTGYGFSGVTPKDCQGQVYEFGATRDGKKFLIKLSAASGELTDVKKVD